MAIVMASQRKNTMIVILTTISPVETGIPVQHSVTSKSLPYSYARRSDKRRENDGQREYDGYSGYTVSSESKHTEHTGHRDRSKESRSSSASAEDNYQEEDAEEDVKDYCKGGYHPVQIGEKFKDGKYVVLRKLGWGHFSTVWLVRDQDVGKHYAMKVVKSAKHYTETALDEVKLLRRVAEADPQTLGARYVTAIVDSFMIEGPNGKHVCMTFEVLGENLLSLIQRYDHRGLPIHLVKQISKQMLLGLDYLHRVCGIIHTDLKPENVLMYLENAEELLSRTAAITVEPDMPKDTRKSPETPETPKSEESRGRSSARVVMVPSQPLSSDRYTSASKTGSSRISSSEKRVSRVAKAVPSQPLSLRSYENDPHNRSEQKRSRSRTSSSERSISARPDEEEQETVRIKIADLGNACWVDHHFTEDIQTRQYRSPEVMLGAPWDAGADIWSIACMIFELLTGNYLFDPRKGTRHGRDDDHLAQIIELLGPMRTSFSLSGEMSKEFFNSKGELRRIKRLKYWGLKDVLHEKYGFHRLEAEEIASFLEPMMSYENRAKAGDLLDHPWLNGVEPILEGESRKRKQWRSSRPWRDWEAERQTRDHKKRRRH
ncbi:serine/threonine protein kinase, CMGC group [Apophysomyces ossiformis]|uniref:non-specific serine/threonine protein kinase n=1 Tax=Apophysomyces ossiformis TaxID=679940 RepID=A0A8H7BSW5_9FUNG|nr:serine/threonine protein kinase, CMGC group [Apophysomyces ossiformis]